MGNSPWLARYTERGILRDASLAVGRREAGTYRAVCAVRFARAIYVLHVFQKKSPSGIRTARPDRRLIEARLRLAREDYEVRYGR